MPEAELVGPNRLNVGGELFVKGVPKSVDFQTAFSLKDNPRFKVTGLDTRAALEFKELSHRPEGDELLTAIRDAADALDVDDDESFDKQGKPAIAALSKALGYPIDKTERDRALATVAKAPQAPARVNVEEIKSAATGKLTLRSTIKQSTAPADEEKVTL